MGPIRITIARVAQLLEEYAGDDACCTDSMRPEPAPPWIRRAIAASIAIAVGIAMYGRSSVPASEAGASTSRDFACVTTRPASALQAEGIVPICDDVYAEAGLDSKELGELRSAREIASRNVSRAFETLRSSPLVVFCRSAKCKIAFGASPEVAAANDLGFASAEVTMSDGSVAPSAVVVTGPVSGTSRILTHELVHAEMKAWVSYDALPTWFNEGTATFIASEPKCEPEPPPDFDVTRLTTKTIWQSHLRTSGKTHETYCAARHEVEKWMARFATDHAKAIGLETLMTSVSNGLPFEQAFGAPG